MELMDSGDLFDFIVKKSKFTEAQAKPMVKDMLRAIHYMHQRNIIHRDLSVCSWPLPPSTAEATREQMPWRFMQETREYLADAAGQGAPTPQARRLWPLHGAVCACSRRLRN